MTEFKTRKGNLITVDGDPDLLALLTLDRIQTIGDRFDTDPRIASVSIYATTNPHANETFLRATAPAGCLIAINQSDLFDPETQDWATAASHRGLWHDWWLTTANDIRKAPVIAEPHAIDLKELGDPSGSHFNALKETPIDTNNLTLTIDVTWLGPHETGAQVLTTAAIPAIADQPTIASIRLVGLSELPGYAQHVTDHPKVTLQPNSQEALHIQTDLIWYPNQIDQRVDISQSRKLGKRVITTYLDLIAYDIGKYHGDENSWAAYRATQRTIALSVDGITTISADVAKRLYQEVPRLDTKRIQPIPLGLDHITTQTIKEKPQGLKPSIRPFILVLGNDFQHKNRDFAIDVWQQVLELGINVDLVLAGLHVKSSSSKEQESIKLKKHTNLRGEATTLGHVSSAERAWLLENAAAVLYPSSAEGFGFVPYEAAILGTPSTFTNFGPLKEISQLTTTPTSWNATEYATDLTHLLTDPPFAQQRVSELREVIGARTWNQFAQEFTEFATKIATMPTVPTSAVTSSTAANELAAVLSSKAWRATAPIRKLKSRSRSKS
ncbi:MAG: glycosyltransferase [Candidatus Nanopelagicales bacterium]|nr:glycosyltransferase [Candidatus Nanopelagicales bacterium]